MPKKSYKFTEDTPLTVSEPSVAYDYKVADGEVLSSEKWNPNVPFHCTQEEFLEHIRSIEQGAFMSIEESDRRFEAWKKEYLASRLR
ncbi:MAG: hypothetical protein FWC94_05875, partial [Bacteroidales bacterium]|nr:hypothetical protein [Bacteroidales bacterium]